MDTDDDSDSRDGGEEGGECFSAEEKDVFSRAVDECRKLRKENSDDSKIAALMAIPGMLRSLKENGQTIFLIPVLTLATVHFPELMNSNNLVLLSTLSDLFQVLWGCEFEKHSFRAIMMGHHIMATFDAHARKWIGTDSESRVYPFVRCLQPVVASELRPRAVVVRLDTTEDELLHCFRMSIRSLFCKDTATVQEAFRILKYYRGSFLVDDCLDALIELGARSVLLDNLQQPDLDGSVHPALFLVCRLTEGKERHKDYISVAEIVPLLTLHLDSSDRDTVWYALVAICNILSHFRQRPFEMLPLAAKLAHMIRQQQQEEAEESYDATNNDNLFKVRTNKVAALVMCNLTLDLGPTSFHQHHPEIPPMIEILTSRHVLQAIGSLLIPEEFDQPARKASPALRAFKALLQVNVSNAPSIPPSAATEAEGEAAAVEADEGEVPQQSVCAARNKVKEYLLEDYDDILTIIRDLAERHVRQYRSAGEILNELGIEFSVKAELNKRKR